MTNVRRSVRPGCTSLHPVVRPPAAAPKSREVGRLGILRRLAVAALVITLSPGVSGDTHARVQAALDWRLPENDCEKPQPIADGSGVLASGGFISHAPTNTTENSDRVPMVLGVDHMAIERYERKRKRWETCVRNYKAELLEDFEVLKSSARYGLTRPQAETIAHKLLQIQAAVMSPDGIADEERREPDRVTSDP